MLNDWGVEDAAALQSVESMEMAAAAPSAEAEAKAASRSASLAASRGAETYAAVGALHAERIIIIIDDISPLLFAANALVFGTLTIRSVKKGYERLAMCKTLRDEAPTVVARPRAAALAGCSRLYAAARASPSLVFRFAR